MIISRTPYRISFFGGGTDYYTWYQEHGGAVLSTSINQYCYLTCRFLPPFFEEKSRIIWSRIEQVKDHADIAHPAVRGVLQYLNIDSGVEIHCTGDLPARSGLGSSSAFTVGLLHAMHALQGRMSSKRELACEAVHIERDVLKENVGIQDQISTAFGGFNKVTICPNGDFKVDPVIMAQARLEQLQAHFLLVFTGVSRSASDIAKEQIKATKDKKAELHTMRQLVDHALEVVGSTGDIAEFGRLLHETWQLKRSLTPGIAPGFVDDIYDKARAAGAIGGKLLGAGGGGFMLFFAPPEHHLQIKQALRDLLWVPFQFEANGSSIVYCDRTAYSAASMDRRDYYHLQPEQQEADAPSNIFLLNSLAPFQAFANCLIIRQDTMQSLIRQAMQITRDTIELAMADQMLIEAVEAASERCITALKAGKKILLAGNGGSAADSQHIAAELVSRLNYNRPGLSAIALTTDTSALTAIGNDYGFERAFARQLEAIGQEGDVFIGISTSGNSPNILAALEAARTQGISSIGLTGKTGGRMAALCDIAIKIPSPATPNIQECHIMFGHIICQLIEDTLFGEQYDPKRQPALKSA